jgi:hypothetical protein
MVLLRRVFRDICFYIGINRYLNSPYVFAHLVLYAFSRICVVITQRHNISDTQPLYVNRSVKLKNSHSGTKSQYIEATTLTTHNAIPL